MKALVADADLQSRQALERLLTGWGHQVVAVAGGPESARRLAEIDPDLLILDWVLPGADGTQLREAVKKRREEKYLVVWSLTSQAGKCDVVRAVQAGADDYLVKPYDAAEVQAKLIAARRLLELHEQLLATRVLVRHQSARDPLTGLWNYRGILEILERELSRANREDRPLGTLLIDLDHFKRINDVCEQLGGDEVLREVASRLNAIMRPYDFLGRYGGEEFLVVLSGCDRDSAARVGERYRQHIASEPVRYRDQELDVTISVGGVVYTPPGPVEIRGLLHALSEVLDHAKKAGRNRVEVQSLERMPS